MAMLGRTSAAYERANLTPPSLGKRILNQIGMNVLGVDFEGQRLRNALAGQQKAFLDDFAGKLQPGYTESADPSITLPEFSGFGSGGDGRLVGDAQFSQSQEQPYEYKAPVRTRDPLNINSPELPSIILRAQQLGVPLNNVLDVFKAQQPDIKIGPDGRSYNAKGNNVPERFGNPQNVNGTITDLNDPENINRVVPEAPVKGAMPVYDNRGHVVDWTLPQGATATIANAAGAESGGRAAGSAPYDFISVPGPDGRPMVVSKAAARGGSFSGQTPDDAEYAKGVAQAEQKRYEGFIQAGAAGRSMESNLLRMSGLLEGVNTGRLTPAGKELASAASSFGIKVDPRWGNVEAADAIANKLVLDVMGGSLGAGFSNADRDFARSMGPQTTQTPQGRKQIIDFSIAKAKRDQQIGQMARQWQASGGRLDKPDRNGKNFYDYLDAWAEANPLVKR